MFIITFLFCLICLVENRVRSTFVGDREECMKELNFDRSTFHPGPPQNFDISPSLQQHNMFCIDRCLLIKQGVINENETLQEEKIKQHFPNASDVIKDIYQTCPIVSNLTDKCEKAFVIGRCIQAQHHRDAGKHFKPKPPPILPNQWQKYKSECTQEIEKDNFNASTSYEITTGLQNEWCMRRCMLIKRGILNEKNVIEVVNVQKYIFGDDQTDFSNCTLIKNENICREAADIDLCINILTHRHF